MICMFKAVRYCQLMYLKTLKMCLKIYQLDPPKSLSAPGLVWQAALKKTKVKSDLLTDSDMLLMIEKGIRGQICHSTEYNFEFQGSFQNL